MRVVTVESSMLAAVAYDEGLEVLQVRFRNGAVYDYSGVPAAVHKALQDAPSKGGYFNHVIRGRFEYRVVDSDAVPPNMEVRVGCGR